MAEALKELIDLDEEPEEDSMQDDMDAFIPVLNKIRDTIAEGSLFKHETFHVPRFIYRGTIDEGIYR